MPMASLIGPPTLLAMFADSALLQRIGNLEGTCHRVSIYFMLPKPHYGPSSAFQVSCCFAVPCYIPRQFFIPKTLIGLWPRLVDWTRVPEASVHENSEPCSLEDDVRLGSAYALP